MSDGWSSVRLSDVLGFQEGPGILAKDFRPEGVPLLRLKGLDRREASLEGCNFVDPRKVEKTWSHFRLRCGEILTSTSASFGRVAVVGSEAEGAIFYTGIIRFWPKDRRIDRKFVEYVLKSPEFAEQGRRAASGSVIQHFGPTHLREMSLLLPPPPEQQAIAGVLGALDDKIELNRRMNATLEAMARALFRSWFVDFDPVRAKAAGDAPAHMDATTAALFPNRFGEDGMPEGWQISPLSAICDQKKVTLDPRAHPEERFDHYSLPAFDAGAGPIRESGSAIKSQKLVVPSEAILFSRLNPTIPRTWWARPTPDVFASVASTEFLVAVPKVRQEMPFLYSLLVSDEFRGDVIARVTGTSNSHQRVKPSAVLEIEPCVAEPQVRAVFSAATQAWFDRVAANLKQSRTLAALRDALLPKLMSGELRVREAEAQVAEAV